MAHAISPVLEYIAALVTGTAGTGRTVPADTFRADVLAAEMGDAEYPPVNADRTVSVRYEGRGRARDQYTSGAPQVLRVTLTVGYRYDLDAPEVSATDGSDRTEAARRRAGDDHEVILRALTWAENQNTTLANGVTVVQIAPAGDETDGAHAVRDAGNGLVLSQTALLVTVLISPLTTWELAA